METVKLNSTFAEWYSGKRKLGLPPLTGNVGRDLNRLLYKMVLRKTEGKTFLPKLRKGLAYDVDCFNYGCDLSRFGVVQVDEYSLINRYFIFLDETYNFENSFFENKVNCDEYIYDVGKMLLDLVNQMLQYYKDNNIVFLKDIES